MFVRDGNVFYSASDLTAAVKCEWALMRRLDSKLGRVETVEEPEDPMLVRAGVLGGAHEERALDDFVREFGTGEPGRPGGVVEIPRPDPPTDADALAHAAATTLDALRAGADVVFQGTFFSGRAEPGGAHTGGFVGFADFLVRSGEDSAGRPVYDVWDTKLARKARITALLQLAAYADQLQREGVPIGESAHLLLGDQTVSSHRVDDILPVYLDRVARLRWMVDERLAATGAIAWGAPGHSACGRCAECAVQVEAARDVQLVGGVRSGQRTRLRDAGIRTIDDLAASEGDVPGIGVSALRGLREQARMQLAAPPAAEGERPTVGYLVHDATGLAALPEPDPGDIFFDFEGDPLWTDERARDWGLEYLFGIIEHEGDEREHFRAFWAHDRAQEKRALTDFLDYVQRRRERHPLLHIYHYADYERSHLQQLCARYGVGEAILDELLRENVFVDLYPVVKRSIRVSERSYSLKKLEPLYMGDDLRESDVTNAADSITAYVDYTLLVAAGEAEEAAAQLAQIEEYNRYDCVSTLRLRDWLLARADEHRIPRRPPLVPTEFEERDLDRREDLARARLLAPIEGVPAVDRDADQTALALAAAAIEYHRREDKTYWWEHFNRQIAPIELWADQRDVFVVHSAEVVTDWRRPPGKRMDSRVVRLRGALSPGSRVDVGATPFSMYDDPVPDGCDDVPAGQRGEHRRIRVLEVATDGDDTELLVEEGAGVSSEGWDAFPVALTPASPIPTKAQREAILEWGASVADALPALEGGASLDLLRREPPRFVQPDALDGAGSPGRGGGEDGRPPDDGGLSRDPDEGGLSRGPEEGELSRGPDKGGLSRGPDEGGLSRGPDIPADIVRSLLRLDDSYIAVQGPPGSGKTYVGAKVIAALIRDHGWRVGVVAQSHEVVENVLRRVLAEGVDPSVVGKRAPSQGYESAPDWRVLENREVQPFLLENAGGVLLGGTAWDFSNGSKVPRGVLDLLVIDEAGQFSLANTIAVGVAARRMLLLGDPQQLPQVSQGLHPEPVDQSALGWLSGGHDVLPAELGYFLETSWRMHPALCAAVSGLAYEGRLASKLPETTNRSLVGIEPGLHAVAVEHAGNATASEEEADRVVDLVRRHLALPWTDAALARHDDPLRPSDIIVVAPYNAQVELLRDRLDAAGLQETPVGTVDKFQGQEAAVAIVSLTASSAADVPRGVGFLLLRNRLNVAISRAKWAAYLVHSPALRDYLPTSATGLAELSAFIRLTSGTASPTLQPQGLAPPHAP